MIDDQAQTPDPQPPTPDTFYVTTPIYYANSAPHLGSLYTTIIADTLARFHKQKGSETYFLTGTDEHGVNIERRAIERGLAPQAYVDDVVRQFKESFAQFGVDTEHGGYDIFMRTTAAFHYQGVSRLWRTVRAARTPKGNEPIYKNFYEGWFCAACAAFKTEDEYSKPESDEDAPRCLVHLTALDRVAEESYFFRLSDYADTLIELYEAKPSLIQPEARRNEVLSFLRSGLQDLSISRLVSSNSWGIPVPDDATHTIYVWFDALSNYITAIGYGNEERETVAGFEKYWQHVTHLVGKDILRFHTVYWHSFLLAAGLPLPEVVYAHGMLLDRDGRKMGKTLGNTIELDILHKHFTNDAIRYFCLREVVFGQDGRVGYEAMIDRTNSDLASGLGNLAARTLTMINRYCGGIIPNGELKEADYIHARRAGVQPDALELASTVELARDQYVQLFESYQFSRALEVAWSIIARIDKFISDAKPWELAKDETQRQTLNVVLYRAAETLRWLAVLLAPVMPDATDALWRQLGLSMDSTTHAHRINPRSLKWNGLTEGTKINASEAIFPRLDKTKIMNDIETDITSNQTAAPPTETTSAIAEDKSALPSSPASSADALPEGVASFITIDDFIKVEMRVGQILTAERVPKADKLLRFTVDVGESEPRQILAGIAEYYEPETLIGRRIAVVSNLAPRKLRGFESQGMVLAASVEGGRPVLATFTEDVPNGARLK
ncbi:MAG: methionine--tRNA ligase [Pyrinomonadaceae bacterium MAG19_C2-C3]|nr:methionine--tRNA ligase [Pyrinomonadaceae bacterium MAG19_C2-C3]